MNISLKAITYTFILALLFSCAHPVNPGGGPKDEDAPVVLSTFPENGSANFYGDKFTVEFDEFIKLEDILNQALISPPLFERPDYKVKGKSLQVKFNEELKPNTTYSVYFGDAITDITEGNPVSNYTYIFSTGSYVDSLSLQGKVVDAYSLEPIEACFVMLYKDDNDTLSLDSLPLMLRPYYLSKTDEEGRFRLNGLGVDEFLLFAILDMNSSLSFDQPNEQIAFIDSLIIPSFVEKKIVDTLLVDSMVIALPDSVESSVSDSLLEKKDNLFSDQLQTYELYLYTEKDTILRLLSSKIIRENTLQFIFNLPANEVKFTTLNHSDRELWHLVKNSKENDTITWFYKNLTLDTLEVLLMYKTDTLEFLNIRLNKPKQGKKRKKDEVEYLKWYGIPQSKTLKPFTSPQIGFYQPLQSIDFDSTVLISGDDTIVKPNFFFTDSLKMQFELTINNIEDTRYSLIIPDSSIFDWNGLANEEMLVQFSTRALSDYGKLILNIALPNQQSILLQLINENNEIVKRDFFSSDTVLIYNYLDAGKYKLKAIFDSNNNGKWDPGVYLKKIQAERVIYFDKELEVRANWEIEEEWGID